MQLKGLISFNGGKPFEGTITIPPVSDSEAVDQIYALVAGAGVAVPAEILAAIYQDDDAHENCSLTACLDPLHPGPCKGWKHNLFQTAPAAWHALEAAKVEKANAKRIAKIADLKSKGLPVPHKLTIPHVAKLHPDAGKTANKASGAAHEASKDVTHNAGVHLNEPGKVTLGQAVKTAAPPVEKGPKGKKPTLASKGIAFVISQPKVTDQYKLDKAAAITPEQWSGLSADDKSIVRGELVKIQKDGFGPQQKKATDLLDKLPAEDGQKPKIGELKPGSPDTITAPSGKVYQKVSLKDVANKPPAPQEKLTPAQEKHLAMAKAGKKFTGYAGQGDGVNSNTVNSLVDKGLLKYIKDDAHTGHYGLTEKGAAHVLPGDKLSDIATPNTKLHASKPKELPQHVQDAVSMAKGQAPGASWAKHQLAAYQPLTAAEFHALPQEHQDKIVSDLQKGAGKFLDPKKVAATKTLLDKFGAPGGFNLQAKKPEVLAADKTVDFAKDLHSHDVTSAQAKDAVAKTAMTGHFLAAQQTAGLTDLDNPDSGAHTIKAVDTAANLLDLKTKQHSPTVLGQHDVKEAAGELQTAAAKHSYATAVHGAKASAYNKIAKTLATDDSKLSPIEKASLQHYQKHLLDHPLKTDSATMDKLAADQHAAETKLDATLHAAVKKANAPKPADMSPAQLHDRATELLGAEGANPKTNLTLTDMNLAGAAGDALAQQEAAKYSPEVLTDPSVAAKLKALASIHTQIKAGHTEQRKLDQHLMANHLSSLKNGTDVHGDPLTSDDRQVITQHSIQLAASTKHVTQALDANKAKLPGAQAQFHAAASKAQGNLKPAEPATLSAYDKATVTDAYSKAWSKHASKAVTFGTDYATSKLMKAHPQYEGLTHDLGSLKAHAAKVAAAHAETTVAYANVPHDDGGVIVGSPEWSTWQGKIHAQQDAEKAFNTLHKQAQAKLDTIRLDAGLKKRALPKIDAPAVKAAAAESGFYTTAAWGAPNYGKTASAKGYMQAKLGDKLGVKHQTASEKKAEKLSAQIAKDAPTGSTVTPSGKYIPPPTTQKTKDQFPSVGEAGTVPTQASAEKYGFGYISGLGTKIGDWPGDKGGAYVANADHLKDFQDRLANPDLKQGIEAQKEFKWSIANMEGKGSPTGAKGSLYNYTGSGYEPVNAKLNELPPGATKTGSTAISNIDKGMAASPALGSDVILYRGFKSPHTVFSSGKWNDVNVAGMEWTQKSYSSTSGALSIAQSFSGYGGVVMRILVPKEQNVHGISAEGGQHPGESEIILQRGLRYRVVADHGKHGSYRYIDVMVVPDPYAKAE